MNCWNKLEKNQCRTCYNTNKSLKLLTSIAKCGGINPRKSYAELITEVSNINVMEHSYREFPQFICEGCTRKLKMAHAFIKQTQQVHERLMTLLIGQNETYKLLDCLQEAQVDIQSCLDIKMEPSNSFPEDDSGGKCNVKRNIDGTKTFLKNSLLDVDVLCAEENDKNVDKDDLIGLEKKRNDVNPVLKVIEDRSSEDIFKTNLEGNLEINSNAETVTSLFQFENESYGDNGSAESVQNLELYYEKIEENRISQNNKNKEKKTLKKCRKIEEIVGKPTEEDDVAVPCNQCNKIFSNSKALMRHQRTSHIPEDQKCICPLCFRKFSRSCNMYTHMRTFHGPDTVPLIRKPSTQERIFQCDKCPRNYTKKKHLNIHIKNKHSQEIAINGKKSEDLKNKDSETFEKHNKTKRYEIRSLCSVCGSSFSSKTHLIVHMRRHTGERPFKCDLCDRAYPRISELTCHRRIHTGEKPFACKICGKTFRVSSKMTTHMRSHTDIRPYKCTQCERSFKYSKDLSIHFRIHTGERPYSCNVCGSTFTQSNTLKAHRVKLGHMDNNLVENNNKEFIHIC